MTLVCMPRRIARSIAGVLVAGALLVGCSSVRNGTPLGSGTSSPTSTRVPTALQSSPTTADPSSAQETASSDPTDSGGGNSGESQFCSDFSSGDLSGIPANNSSKADVKRISDAWSKLAQDAPAAISADAHKVADFIKGFADGQIDPVAAQQVSPAIEHVINYFSAHCFGH